MVFGDGYVMGIYYVMLDGVLEDASLVLVWLCVCI